MSKLTKHKNGSTSAIRTIRKDDDGRPCILLIDGLGIELKSSYKVTVSADAKTINLEKIEVHKAT